ncbi:phage head closure protein [Snodgrassella communis]|uniref:Putative phage head-tail adaptor n=2 Tax=Snodgrassella communis TaxID=2946699 RepID=A0A836MN00_9NEIS|nr:phage head closure protein [Snodgrassella communis]KDN13816.1 putative phage head-tail adaptor [Snodgrassella communis]
MGIAAGKLDKRVLIQRPEISKDEFGGIKKNWVDVGKVWANMSYLSGREFVKNGLDSASSTVSIRVRRNSITAAITPQYRIMYKGSIFNIQAVLPDSVHSEMINLPCIAGINEG